MAAQIQSFVKAAQNFSQKPSNASLLQRQNTWGQRAKGDECDKCRKKKSLLQRSAVNSGFEQVPSIVHEVIRSPGRPLDDKIRAYMESQFKHDFSRVRVHTDAKASESAESVNSLAYTVNSNIVFGNGHFTPETIAGRRLIAHELTHVMQSENNHIAPELKIGSVDSPEERAAKSCEDLSHPIGNQFSINLLQRKTKGGSVGGFLANIGSAITEFFTGKEKDYNEKSLEDYLKYLKDNNDIEDDFDSDNKARAIVNKHMFEKESLNIRILLVKELITSYVGKDDRQSILKILEAAKKEERSEIGEAIGYKRFYDEFEGNENELDQICLLLPGVCFFKPEKEEDPKPKKKESTGQPITLPAPEESFEQALLGLVENMREKKKR